MAGVAGRPQGPGAADEALRCRSAMAACLQGFSGNLVSSVKFSSGPYGTEIMQLWLQSQGTEVALTSRCIFSKIKPKATKLCVHTNNSLKNDR